MAVFSRTITNFHSYEEAEKMWEKGLDTDTAFYKEMHDLYASQVDHIVSDEGMEAFINAMFSSYYKTVAPDSFFKPEGDYEILQQSEDHFTIKQTKVIDPQEMGGPSYRYVYHISYELEDGTWKFADLERIVYDEEVTE